MRLSTAFALATICVTFALASLAFASPVVAWHPLSVSSSRIVVDGRAVEVTLRCQSLTLVESLPLDANADRTASPSEVDAARASVAEYLTRHYRLFAVDPEPATGAEEASAARGTSTALPGAWVSSTVTKGAAREGLGAEDVVDFVLRFESPVELRALRVEFDGFRESDPLHRDHASIVWNGASGGARVLWVEDPSWTFVPSAAPRGVVRAYVELGIEHIVFGYDHVAFVIALVVASRRLRSILGVVTAFTVAHSVTLALAALGYVSVSGRVVEPLIAASIAYVALRNVFARSERTLWPEAFGFGLVHGLGFAGSIAESLAAESQKLAALFGFNVGVEIGQLGVVAALLAILFVLRRALAGHAPSEPAAADASLAPRPVRVVASLVVATLGVWWCVERVAFDG